MPSENEPSQTWKWNVEWRMEKVTAKTKMSFSFFARYFHFIFASSIPSKTHLKFNYVNALGVHREKELNFS